MSDHRAVALKMRVGLPTVAAWLSLTTAFAWIACGCAPESVPVGATVNAAPRHRISRAESEQTIYCKVPTWNFGTVDQTKTREVAHTFCLENPTNEPLRIDKIEPTCGCIVPDDYPKELVSGATADVTMRVNIIGPPGEFRKFVNVRLLTEPPSDFRLTIVGQVTVSPAFHLVPTVVDFGTLDESEIKTRTVKISRSDGSPVRFVETESESDALSQVRAVSGDAKDSYVELTLSLDGSRLNPGDFQSRVVGHTLHTEHREVTIPIRAKIAGQPHGLVNSLFVKLAPGGFQDVPLSDGNQAVPDVELIRFDESGPLAVELLPPSINRASATIRVSRVAEPSDAKLVRGELVAKLTGREKPVRIPLRVFLSN